MTQAQHAGMDPQWDMADRLKKSLRTAGIGVQEIAEYLEVSRNTVSTWINGRITPNKQTRRLWAMRCGVRLEWLEEGDPPPHPQMRDQAAGPDNDECARQDSNLQPLDPKSSGSVVPIRRREALGSPHSAPTRRTA